MRRRPEEREAADERILGSGEFVEGIWQATEAAWQAPSGWSWQELLAETTEKTGLTAGHLLGGSRERRVSRARRELFLRALEEGGLSITQLAKLSARNPATVSRAIGLAREEAAEEARKEGQ